MSILLISAILRKPWFIDQDFVTAHAPVIIPLIQRGYQPVPGTPIEEKSKIPYAVNSKGLIVTDNSSTHTVPGNIKSGYNYNEAPAGSIAVIPVKGVMLKEDLDDGCGYFVAGSQTIGRRIEEADKHPNIKGTILIMDGPGGTVDGTQALADVIKNATKPVVAFVDGMIASAHYFVASSADHIILENESASAGCIGTMLSIVDYQPYFESLGVKFHDIVSNLSPDKNKAYYQALEGNYDPIKENLLDPHAGIFVNYVKSNRPSVKEDALSGKHFLAVEALKVGLADEIGNFGRAVEKVNQLSDQADDQLQNSNSLPKPKQYLNMSKLSFLTALLAVEALEITDEGVFLNESQLNTIEARLAEASQLETRLENASQENQTALQGVRDELATATQTIADRDATIAEQQTTIEQLTKGPGATPAGATAQNDATGEGDNLNEVIAGLSTAEAMQKLQEQGFKY